MVGIVLRSHLGYAFIKCESGEVIFAHAAQMQTDEVGRRYLIAGEQVEFEIRKNDKPGRHEHVAANIRILSPREPAPADYSEEGTVDKVSRNGDFCFVLRPYGGVAMLHRDAVRQYESKSEDGSPYFFREQVWSFSISPPIIDEHRAWLATDARELCAEESELEGAAC
jgi:cold shock CspA family protein